MLMLEELFPPPTRKRRGRLTAILLEPLLPELYSWLREGRFKLWLPHGMLIWNLCPVNARKRVIGWRQESQNRWAKVQSSNVPGVPTSRMFLLQAPFTQVCLPLSLGTKPKKMVGFNPSLTLYLQLQLQSILLPFLHHRLAFTFMYWDLFRIWHNELSTELFLLSRG